MGLNETIAVADLGAGVMSRPAAERVVEGDPVFTTWEIHETPAATGFWSGTPGAHRMARDAQTWEQFHILEGEIELTPEGGPPQRFGAGDVVTIPPGFHGLWRTLTTVRKYYVTLTL